MEIINEVEREETEFKYLELGSLFIYNDIVYIKTNIAADILNCVDLKTGQMDALNYHDKVFPVKGKLYIS